LAAVQHAVLDLDLFVQQTQLLVASHQLQAAGTASTARRGWKAGSGWHGEVERAATLREAGSVHAIQGPVQICSSVPSTGEWPRGRVGLGKRAHLAAQCVPLPHHKVVVFLQPKSCLQ
jgi:hypothetical protein